MADDPWVPQRLDARIGVSAAEDEIYRSFWAALSRWLVQTARRVLRGSGPPDLDGIWAQVPMWHAAVESVVQGAVRRAMRQGYVALFGDDYPWDQRVFVASYLAEVTNRMVRTPDEVYDLVAGQVAEAVNLGEGIPQIRDRVEQLLSTTATERWPNRATVVARTECLPGDAIVNGAYVTSAYRRAYSGPMVTIETMGGRQFTGTPNHPVLTSDGWAGLGTLLQGDHLICDSKSIQAAGAPGNHDVNAGQTTIAQVFDAAQTVGVTCRERTTEPDFHGDGQDGYVDILRSFGVLPVGRFAPIGKGSIDLLLPPTDAEKVTLACLRAPFARSDSIDQTTGFLGVAPGETSGLDDSANGLQVCPVHRGESFTRFPSLIALRDFGLGEVSPKGWTLAAAIEELASSVGQRSEDAAPEQDKAHLIWPKSGLSGHPPVAHPRDVELDEVVSIKVGHWSGHVFNLTTVHGYFVSGGVYTGNTIGALNAGRNDAFRAYAEDEPDEDLEKVWLATSDSRTRQTHRDAEGQRVPLDQPFIVGGFPLMFPGDPSGPPQEVIQCRCTQLLVEVGESVDMSNRQFRKR